MALRAALPTGGRVGVVAYNCHTVANAVQQAGCTPVFVDVAEDLRLDLHHLSSLKLDALVLTNLFGIHNDIAAVRQALGDAPIIVDNAHGYGLPAEGDFCVYSINQGKFPSLGEGGLLMVNNPQYQAAIDAQYADLKGYSMLQEAKLYITMLLKAIMHLPWIYKTITLRLKQQRQPVACREQVILKRMAKGVSRMYQHALPNIAQEIAQQQHNAQVVADCLLNQKMAQRAWYGQNAFMLIAQTQEPEALKNHFAQHGIETATHFARAIEWASEFGYIPGECPTAEQLTKTLVMIPMYVALPQFKV
jgi:dTDP-4-amino-4,6-dideoxygalactose transaminase